MTRPELAIASVARFSRQRDGMPKVSNNTWKEEESPGITWKEEESLVGNHLGCFLPLCSWVEWRLREEYRLVLRIEAQLVEKDLLPDLLHPGPVPHHPALHRTWTPCVKDASPLSSRLVSHKGVFS